MKTNYRSTKISSVCIFMLTFLFFSFSLTSCNKKDSNSTSKTSSFFGGKAEVKPSHFSYLKKIPKNSTGYVTWNLTTDSFTQYKNSKWFPAKSSNVTLQNLPKEFSDVIKDLKETGIDVFDPSSIYNTIPEGVFYLVDAKAQNERIVGGLLNTGKNIKVKKFIETLKNFGEYKLKNKAKVETIKGADEGFSFTFKENTAFLAYKDRNIAFSNKKEEVERLLEAKEAELPSIVLDETYTKTTRDFLPPKTRIIEGFVNSSKSEGGLSGSFFRAVAFDSGFTDIPKSNLRLLYNDDNSETSNIKELLTSSTSDVLFNKLPSTTLSFISIDAKSMDAAFLKLLAMQNKTEKKRTPDPEEEEIREVLKKLNRVSLVINSGQTTQSLVPIPEILLAIEGKDSKNLNAKIKTMITKELSEMMGPNLSWNKDSDNIESIMTPYISINLRSTEDATLLATGTNLIKSIISEDSNEANLLASKASDKTKNILRDKKTLMVFYLDYNFLGSYLETIKNTVMMYAQKNPQVSQLFEPKAIAKLKSQGRNVTAIIPEEEGIYATSFFEKN